MQSLNDLPSECLSSSVFFSLYFSVFFSVPFSLPRVRDLHVSFTVTTTASHSLCQTSIYLTLSLLFSCITEASRGTDGDECQEDSLADVNETISMEQEETMNSLFECTNDEDGQYIDLLLNPERYTGIERRVILPCLVDIYGQHCSLYLLDSTLAYSSYFVLFFHL